MHNMLQNTWEMKTKLIHNFISNKQSKKGEKFLESKQNLRFLGTNKLVKSED